MAIQYPINLESDRFTVYDTNLNQPVVDGNGRPKVGVKWASQDVSQMIPNLAPHIKWLLEVKEPAPAYDSTTQRLETFTTIDVENETVTKGYNIIDLTQGEIDAKVPAHYETEAGIKLAVSEIDQNAFTRMMTLISTAGMPDEAELAIKDCFGVSHPITVGQLKIDMVAYGMHCYTQFLSAGQESEI